MAFKQKLQAEKIKLLDFYQKVNVSSRVSADEFGIGRSQATNLIKNKTTIVRLWISHSNDQMKSMLHRKTESVNIKNIIIIG